MFYLYSSLHNEVKKKSESRITLQEDAGTDLSEIWILGDIVVVSVHGHSLQVLCDVGQLLCLSSWKQEKKRL